MTGREVPRSVQALIVRDLAAELEELVDDEIEEEGPEPEPDRGIIDVADITPAWDSWPLLFARADEMGPPVFDAWLDVEEAVERLRIAIAEHDYREQLLHRVRDAIQPQGLHLTLDQVRLVLDAIEAGA